MTQRFPVVWITGLAGAGKTTLAKRVHDELRHEYPNTLIIDGDAIREVCGNDLGYSDPDRIKNAFRLARLAKFLNEQGQIVICSTMSLYPMIWEWNRKEISCYLEVFLKVDSSELGRRDKKSLYSSPASSVVGRDLSFTEPPTPHLTLVNNEPGDLDRNVEQILDPIRQRLKP